MDFKASWNWQRLQSCQVDPVTLERGLRIADCGFSFRECIGNLDDNLTGLALRMLAHFAECGEDQELVSVGHEIVEKYPRLWEVSVAMANARSDKREEWRRADEEESARLYPNG